MEKIPGGIISIAKLYVNLPSPNHCKSAKTRYTQGGIFDQFDHLNDIEFGFWKKWAKAAIYKITILPIRESGVGSHTPGGWMPGSYPISRLVIINIMLNIVVVFVIVVVDAQIL